MKRVGERRRCLVRLLLAALACGGGLRLAPAAGGQDPEPDPARVGQWSAPFQLPCVAIHLSILPSGDALFWSRQGDRACFRWEIGSGSFTPVPPRWSNLFCSGHAFLPDGRLFVAGGHVVEPVGIPDANVFDPGTGRWTRAAPMNGRRWYPTVCALANGDQLVAAGFVAPGRGHNEVPQVWTPGKGGKGRWRTLTGARFALPLYPWLYQAPNGRVFLAGPGQESQYLDVSAKGRWSTVALNRFGLRKIGSSAMYDDGQVLVMGGHDPPTDTAEVIDLRATRPAWRYVGKMAFARRQHTSTLLPDGTVLVTGGTSERGFNTASGAVLPPEVWDPQTEAWTTLAPMASRRLYHSTAALLPDGRVLVAGGGQPAALDSADTDHRDAEIFSPPYLFRGPRPRLDSAPESVSYGQSFAVVTPDAAVVRRVTWVRLSSVTHGFNQNQRINRLVFRPQAGGLEVTAPSDPRLCPPGHYLLFLVSAQDVPSLGKVVRIR